MEKEIKHKSNIFASVNSPQDVKALKRNDLPELCSEIREVLINTLSKSGGHLASNLGVVELTVAIHRVFDTPKDQIVWDVGHQSYTHKLLTGRKDRFSTIRKKDGLSGFPDPLESEHDSFVTGHSSTSLAAAFGLARAKSISGDEGHVVAVVGDGAAGGGMFYEGLNNIGRGHDRLIVILNDNKESISKNIGGVAKYLSEIRIRPKYFKVKDHVDRFVTDIPFIGKWLRRKIVHSKSMLKYALYHTTWFEEFGFSFIGPVDGHDLKALCEVLSRAKSLNKPVFIQVETIKGKGYKYAEENPGAYHGVKPFNPETGNAGCKTSEGFSEHFGNQLVCLGKKNDKICAITSAMKYATGLDLFAAKFPRRFLDVGIAEPLSITCAAGMAKNGLIPVVAVYSTFLQRAYDQILNDAAISGLHIVLAIDRAGIIGEDGVTHQGIFDVPYLLTIPGVKVFSPSSFRELDLCLERAIFDESSVVAVRYPKGGETQVESRFEICDTERVMYSSDESKELLVVTYGRIFANCANAVVKAEEQGIKADVLKLVNLSISDGVIDTTMEYKKIIFIEESSQSGSVSEKLGAVLLERGYRGKYTTHTIGNVYIRHQTIDEALKEYHLDTESILKLIKEN